MKVKDPWEVEASTGLNREKEAQAERVPTTFARHWVSRFHFIKL